MTTRLEHANITVPDVDAAIAFLRCVDPTFVVMHDSGAAQGSRWVHVGSPDGYLALQSPYAPGRAPAQQRYHDVGVNHLGLVVDDAEAVAARLRAAGYRESYDPQNHPARLRRYFLDDAGVEWEFVQYLTDDPSERFSYD